jgi:Cys-rich protein (TIGR01571 family)
MRVYDYPRVPRSSQSQVEQLGAHIQAPRPPQQPDNRFSWVQTPAEARAYSWQHNDRSGNHPMPDVPPLPRLPEQLTAVTAQQTAGLTGPIDIAEPLPTQRAHDVDQHVARRSPAPAYTPQDQVNPSQHVPYDHAPRHTRPTILLPVNTIPPTQVVQVAQHFDPDLKNSQNMQYAKVNAEDLQQHHQQDVQQNASRPPAQPVPIAPDINPLSPTTPTKTHPTHTHHHQPTTPTTNLPIIHPPDPLPSPFAPPTVPSPQTYTHSLFSCALPTICLPTLFCPCITYGRTQHRLSNLSSHKSGSNMLDFSLCNGSCVSFAVLCGVNLVLAVVQRRRVRKLYGIEGTLGDDLLLGAGCCCCSLARDEKEVKLREEAAATSKAEAEGYLPVAGMRFEPPPSSRGGPGR